MDRAMSQLVRSMGDLSIQQRVRDKGKEEERFKINRGEWAENVYEY